MVYLESIIFPDEEREMDFRLNIKRTCYDTIYPFFVLSKIGLDRIDFEPITILHGGNGSGKTTVLNVIAEKLGLLRETLFNRSSFFDDYTALCLTNAETAIPEGSRIIASDDVFDYMQNIRSINDGVDARRAELLDEYRQARRSSFRLRSIADYDELKKHNSARRKTQSGFVREQLMGNVREQSNGESASFFFKQRIDCDALYLLDEPENSLSPKNQIELAAYLEETARCMDCQLVISTHSPFLLSIGGAKIYDLDSSPVDIKNWTELENVREYAEFFLKHMKEFGCEAY